MGLMLNTYSGGWKRAPHSQSIHECHTLGLDCVFPQHVCNSKVPPPLGNTSLDWPCGASSAREMRCGAAPARVGARALLAISRRALLLRPMQIAARAAERGVWRDSVAEGEWHDGREPAQQEASSDPPPAETMRCRVADKRRSRELEISRARELDISRAHRNRPTALSGGSRGAGSILAGPRDLPRLATSVPVGVRAQAESVSGPSQRAHRREARGVTALPKVACRAGGRQRAWQPPSSGDDAVPRRRPQARDGFDERSGLWTAHVRVVCHDEARNSQALRENRSRQEREADRKNRDESRGHLGDDMEETLKGSC